MARGVWNERLRVSVRICIRCAPLVVAMGLFTAWSEDALSIEDAVRATIVALIVGMPFLFLVGIAVQMFPRSWYEK